MVDPTNVRLFRKIVKAHEAVREAEALLKEVQQTQKRIASLEKARNQKLEKARSLAAAHHRLYLKLQEQKKDAGSLEKKRNIARAMSLIRRERQRLLAQIRSIALS